MNFNRLLISIGPGPEPLRFSIAARSFRFSQHIVLPRVGRLATPRDLCFPVRFLVQRDYSAE